MDDMLRELQLIVAIVSLGIWMLWSIITDEQDPRVKVIKPKIKLKYTGGFTPTLRGEGGVPVVLHMRLSAPKGAFSIFTQARGGPKGKAGATTEGRGFLV